MAIVADTHAIIWYLVEPERLSQGALDALERSKLHIQLSQFGRYLTGDKL